MIQPRHYFSSQIDLIPLSLALLIIKETFKQIQQGLEIRLDTIIYIELAVEEMHWITSCNNSLTMYFRILNMVLELIMLLVAYLEMQE